jgi:sugar phosphate isomerase/epimerase
MSDINIGSLNPRMREAALRELLSALGACRRLGMDVITVHPAFMTPLGFVSKDKVNETTKAGLRKLDAYSQELGVKVALENMPRSPFSMATTPRDLLELIEGTDLGICLDVGHANTAGKLKEFVKLKKNIVNLHVHDNRGETDEHLPVGDGTVDFPWLIRSLSGYKGRYVIESRGLEDAMISRDRLQALLSKA